MSDSENKAEDWLATDDPTSGELPATEFIGSKKDLEQTLPAEPGDGEKVATLEEPTLPEPTEPAAGEDKNEETAQ